MRRAGQVSTEHAILLGVITAALVGIQLYAKRGLQAGIKSAADQLSPFRIGGNPAGDPDGERAQAAGMISETGERRNRATAIRSDYREAAVMTDTELTQRVTQQATASGHVATTTRTTETSQTSGEVKDRPRVSVISAVVTGLSSEGD